MPPEDEGAQNTAETHDTIRGPEGRSRRGLPKLIQILAGVAALILIIAWLAGAFHEKVQPGVATAPEQPRLPAGHPTAQAVSGTIQPPIEVVGTVRSEELVHLSSRVSAWVDQVLVTAGDSVTNRQLLVRLDSRDLARQLEAAEARFRQTEIEYERAKDLLAGQAGTQQLVDAAEAAFEGARAETERVRVMITYTELRSPVNGVVTDRQIEPGDLANPGQTLLTVYDPLRMRLEVPVPMRFAERLRLQDELPVRLGSPELETSGIIAEVVAEADPQSRTRMVKVRLPEVGGKVLPGTFGRLLVPGDAREAVMVPASAVYRVGQLTMVQLVDPAAAIERRYVTVGLRQGGDHVEILSGLHGGETVVLDAPFQLTATEG